MRLLSLVIILFISSCTVGTFYEFDDSSEMKLVEIYSDENLAITFRPLIGHRSVIRIFALKDEVDVEVRLVNLDLSGDTGPFLVKGSSIQPGSRILNQNYSYEMVRNYEIDDLPKSIYGHLDIELEINGVLFKGTYSFSMRRNNVGYLEALQSI